MTREDVELINEISEVILGYREGCLRHILSHAKKLKEDDKEFKQQCANELFDAIKNLADLAKDIEQG